MDNTRRDAQDRRRMSNSELRVRSARPPRRRSGQDKDHDLQLLRRLHKEQGNNKTAKLLGVDRKTVWRALDAGRLTPRLRDALEREQKAAELAAEREEAGGDQLELRVEGLERRLQDVEEQLATGLTGLRGESWTGLRDEVKTLAWTRPELAGAGTGSDAASTASKTRSPHRTYPQVVTCRRTARRRGGVRRGDAAGRRVARAAGAVQGALALGRGAGGGGADAGAGTGADRGTPPHPAARPAALGVGPARSGVAATGAAAGHGAAQSTTGSVAASAASPVQPRNAGSLRELGTHSATHQDLSALASRL